MEFEGHTLDVEKYIEQQYEREGKNKPTDTITTRNSNLITNTVNN